MISTPPSLLAQPSSVIESFRRGFASNSSLASLCLILVAAMALVGIVHMLWMAQRRAIEPRVIDDPHRLFEALLRFVKLARHERRLLRRLAASARLANPAALFLSPALFDGAVATAAANPKPGRRCAKNDPRLLRLRTDLFGMPA